MGLLRLFLAAALQLPLSATLEIAVTGNGGPVARAQVVAAGRTVETGPDGRVTIQVPAGDVEVTVIKAGFAPVTLSVTASAGAPRIVPVRLEAQEAIEEHVTVSATRTATRIEDQPMRVAAVSYTHLTLPTILRV